MLQAGVLQKASNSYMPHMLGTIEREANSLRLYTYVSLSTLS
jgi:hypothetical protein